jgi:hypothetical protein
MGFVVNYLQEEGNLNLGLLKLCKCMKIVCSVV